MKIPNSYSYTEENTGFVKELQALRLVIWIRDVQPRISALFLTWQCFILVIENTLPWLTYYVIHEQTISAVPRPSLGMEDTYDNIVLYSQCIWTRHGCNSTLPFIQHQSVHMVSSFSNIMLQGHKVRRTCAIILHDVTYSSVKFHLVSHIGTTCSKSAHPKCKTQFNSHLSIKYDIDLRLLAFRTEDTHCYQAPLKSIMYVGESFASTLVRVMSCVSSQWLRAKSENMPSLQSLNISQVRILHSHDADSIDYLLEHINMIRTHHMLIIHHSMLNHIQHQKHRVQTHKSCILMMQTDTYIASWHDIPTYIWTYHMFISR